ncbi:hypothetical protein [Rodentibacter caecimuris]|uniref:Competence protein ComB n=1 Tax=Rodentibacter caecimuris TaxID=1796644 RepID=A0ABX3L0D4_9PAST|nr:hypothetical protein BKG89_01695 [Rodentibacter heylii]
MNGINLFPWRQVTHRHQSKVFINLAFIFVGIGVGIYCILNSLTQAKQHELQKHQNDLNEIQRLLTQSQIQISQLRQYTKDIEELNAIPVKQRQEILDMVAKLPFEEGELQFLHFTAEQIQLIGSVLNQQEFEKIHQFLAQKFTKIKLARFTPEQNKLNFQFNIELM